MTLSVLLDIVVAGLLLATIGYCMMLSRRLGALRDDKQQLEALVDALTRASQQAEAGIAALKDAAGRIGREVQQTIETGQGLRSDLSYIIELGTGVADRLEAAIRNGREEGKPVTAAPAAERRGAPRRERPLAADRGAAPIAAATDADPAAPVAGFPSRAERLLRRALDARR